ncbi:MAG: fatty acid desaturase [Chitinophagales bacterium]
MHHEKGLLFALLIVTLWCACVGVGFLLDVNSFQWWIVPLMLLQTHLYTGIFITAHDAMHGTVSSNKKINTVIGWICAGLFAFNYYPRLYKKHHEHHRYVATADDPDFHTGNFLQWYFSFLKNYLTIWQLVLMAVTFNVLLLMTPQINLILFWIVPSLFSTLQLFYFGTYLPHKGEFPISNKHHAATLSKNHFLAFITCYFFGYHYEHHDSPGTPWWLLHKKKSF